MPKRVHRKRMSKKGGEGVLDNAKALGTSVGSSVIGLGQGAVSEAEKLGQGAADFTKGAYNKTAGLLGSVVVDKKPKDGANATGFWSLFGYGNQASPSTGEVVAVPPQEQNVVKPQGATQGGSRRRKRSGRKSKNMFSGLMKMVGFKTKKRGKRGGTGGSDQGIPLYLTSAANAQGNNIYDLATFNPLKPFTGGMKGGCMPSKFIPLSPAPFPGDGMIGGKSKRNRKRRGGTRKCAWK